MSNYGMILTISRMDDRGSNTGDVWLPGLKLHRLITVYGEWIDSGKIVVNKLTLQFITIIFISAEKYTYISSSFVREIALLKGDVSQFVPKIIAEALQKKVE